MDFTYITEEEAVKILRKNFDTLCKKTDNLLEVVNNLYENKILHFNDKEIINNDTALPNKYQKCDHMYSILIQKCPESIKVLLPILKKTGNGNLAGLLDGSVPAENIYKIEGIWFEVEEFTKLFTGRQKIINKIHKKMCQFSNKNETLISRLLCLVGLGGVGKSELARKYARDYHDFYEGNCIWINAETYKGLCDSFRRLAKEKLSIKTTDPDFPTKLKSIESVVIKIYEYFKGQKCLFIMDNVQEFNGRHGIRSFLPLSLKPNTLKTFYFLITTRTTPLIQDIDEIPIDVLTPEESKQLITEELKLTDKSETEPDFEQNLTILVKKLQMLPLALVQAIAYMKDQQRKFKKLATYYESRENPFNPITNYLKALEEKSKLILGFNFSQITDNSYSHTILLTWQISMDKIEKEHCGQLALYLMQICAYLMPDFISTNELEVLMETREQIEQFEDAILLLDKYSMGTIQGGQMKIHRLVQEVQRINVREKGGDFEIRLIKKLLFIMRYKGLSEFGSTADAIWLYAVEKGANYFHNFRHAGVEITKELSIYDTEMIMKKFQDIYGNGSPLTQELKLIYASKLMECDHYDNSLAILKQLYEEYKIIMEENAQMLYLKDDTRSENMIGGDRRDPYFFSRVLSYFEYYYNRFGDLPSLLKIYEEMKNSLESGMCKSEHSIKYFEGKITDCKYAIVLEDEKSSKNNEVLEEALESYRKLFNTSTNFISESDSMKIDVNFMNGVKIPVIYLQLGKPQEACDFIENVLKKCIPSDDGGKKGGPLSQMVKITEEMKKFPKFHRQCLDLLLWIEKEHETITPVYEYKKWIYKVQLYIGEMLIKIGEVQEGEMRLQILFEILINDEGIMFNDISRYADEILLIQNILSNIHTE